MSAEKLPEYVEHQIDETERLIVALDESPSLPLEWRTGDPLPDSYKLIDLRAAIHRYANERVAEALEKAAKVADESFNEDVNPFGKPYSIWWRSSADFIRREIRSLIPSEARKA